MDRIGYELSILARAVAYKNLSGASSHVGLSQPQLSRIVKRIEENFGLVLLDRSAKRNASWTPSASRLAECYTKKMRAFYQELLALIGETYTRQLQIGTLEGVSRIALQFVRNLFEKAGIRIIEIDVFDLDRLEELFSRGELDLIFTTREPGKKKFQNIREIGFQSLEQKESNPHYHVVSTFEYSVRRDKFKGAEKLLISNSLSMRRDWFQEFGGVGTIPSRLKKIKGSKLDTERVMLIGSDTLSPAVWESLKKFDFQVNT